MKWANIIGALQETAVITSISANILLIFIVYKKSPQQIGSYKYLMIYIAIFEMLYSIIDVILEPVVLSQPAIFLVVVNLETTVCDREACIYLICGWVAFFGSFMALFIVQFIYRYLVVSGSILLKSFNDWRLVLWMCGPPLCGLSWAFMTFAYFYPDNQIDNAIRNVLLEDFDWKVENVTYMGPYLYRTMVDDKYPYRTTLICMLIMLTEMVLSILTIVIFAIKCSFKIQNYVKTTKNLSKKSNGLQYQLFYALVIQTLIPVILLHLPVSILFVLTILSIDLGRASSLVGLTIAFFPALDPFPVILIVKHYRFAMMNVVTTPVVNFIRKRLDHPV